jgi:hypothetical protein
MKLQSHSKSTFTQLLTSLVNDPFLELFEYVKKNEKLFKFLYENKIDDVKQKALYLAINNGDIENTIFNDQECYLHLLNLIKTKQITFLEGMTVHVYLLVLMQFSNRLPIREEDRDVKSTRQIQIDSLAKHGQLTHEGSKFLTSIFNRLKDEVCDNQNPVEFS